VVWLVGGGVMLAAGLFWLIAGEPLMMLLMFFSGGVMLWAGFHFRSLPYIEVFFGDLLINPYRVRQRRIHLADIARVHERGRAVDIDLKSGQGVSIPLNGLRRDDVQELLSVLRATQLD
jgi:hypothetical protein